MSFRFCRNIKNVGGLLGLSASIVINGIEQMFLSLVVVVV